MTIKNKGVAAFNAFSAFCMLILNKPFAYGVPKKYAYFTETAFIGWNITIQLIDHFNSDNSNKNYKIVKAAGFSDAYIAFCAIFGHVILSFLGTNDNMTLPHYSEDLWFPSKEDLSLKTICTGIALVFATDWSFYFVHRILHERFPKIHLLHHCCVFSSLTTNLYFEPLDIMLEFLGPIICIKMVSLYVFDSSWMVVMCTSILQTFYYLSHDEYLNLVHTKHHRGCAPAYFIYNNYFYDDPEKERIRKLIPNFSKIGKAD